MSRKQSTYWGDKFIERQLNSLNRMRDSRYAFVNCHEEHQAEYVLDQLKSLKSRRQTRFNINLDMWGIQITGFWLQKGKSSQKEEIQEEEKFTIKWWCRESNWAVQGSSSKRSRSSDQYLVLQLGAENVCKMYNYWIRSGLKQSAYLILMSSDTTWTHNHTKQCR